MKRISIKKLTKVYIIAYCITMLFFCAINGPLWWGEYDDYTLPVASILNDFNFEIDEEDLDYYKEIFPELTSIDENRSLSGYMAKNGRGELTWYFPTYAIVSIPMILFLSFLKLPASYGFVFTNIFMVCILLVYANKILKLNDLKKLAVTILLSINPIMFYFPWLAAEVCIYTFIGLSMLSWHSGKNKQAAIFISLAGTLNPTIMIVGIVMIFDYLVNVWKKRSEENTFWNFIKENIKETICYGLCYVIGLIPMIYNVYHTGHINLTASYSSFTDGRESTLERFQAHFLDWNYGYLPYYGIFFLVAFLLLLGAIRKKHWRYVEMIIAFVLNVFLYSIMVHINCGGSGIARYGSWCAVIVILAVLLYYEEIVSKHVIQIITKVIIGIHVCVLGALIYIYGPYAASNTWGLNWSPIAKTVLDNVPGLYNPLGSTFYANLNGMLGGYDYETPLIYVDDEGYVRKMLVSKKDIKDIQDMYVVLSGEEQWLENQLKEISEKEEYVTIPKKYKVAKCMPYTLGENICFAVDGYNADRWVAAGLAGCESWGSWTVAKELIIRMKIECSAEIIQGHVTAGTFEGMQTVEIYVNETMVYDDLFVGGEINFEFPKSANGIYEIRMKMPDVQRFNEIDKRMLGLSIGSMSFTTEPEKVFNSYTPNEDICFAIDGYNADKWISEGISAAESWGSWTDSESLLLRMEMQCSSKRVEGHIIAGVYGQQQRVIIYVNDETVYNEIYYGESEGIHFDFPCSLDGKYEMYIFMPDAKAGEVDARKLGLSIGHMSFYGK